MSELSRYKIVLDGTTMPDSNREDVLRALADLFHSRPSQMKRLLTGNEVTLKKEYSKSEATNICRAIRNAGARCKIVVLEEEQIEIADDSGSLSDFSDNREKVGVAPRRTVQCPACGKENDADRTRCRYCDFILESGSDSQPGSTGNAESEPASAGKEPGKDPDKVSAPSSQSDLRKFVGPNADYYLRQFDRMGSIQKPSFRPSWHWPALLVFPFWALYRKLWLWAAVYYLTSMAVMMWSGSTLLLLVNAVAWPLAANYIYYLHAAKRIRGLAASDLGSGERKQALANSGGVSKIALWLGVALSVVLTNYMMGSIRESMLEAYDEQFGGGAASSTLVYGDGQPLDGALDGQTELATTVKAINRLTDALKIVIAAGNRDTLDRTVESLVMKSTNRELMDGWDNPIVISRQGEAVKLRSPGGDGQLNTDDDIIQTVPFGPNAL